MQHHRAGGLGNLGAGWGRAPDPAPRNISLDSDMEYLGYPTAGGAPPARSGSVTPNAAAPHGIAAGGRASAGSDHAATPSDPLALMFTLALELHNRLSAEEAVSNLQGKQLGFVAQASGGLHRRLDALDQGLTAQVEALRGEAAAAGAAARQAGAAATLLHGRMAAAEQEAARVKAALTTAQREIRALTGTVMQLVSVAESHAEALRRSAGGGGSPAAAAARHQQEEDGDAVNWGPQTSADSDHGDGEVPAAAAPL